MNRSDAKPLGDLLKDMLTTYRLKDKYTEVQLQKYWNDLMGPSVTSHTRKVIFYNGKLFLELDSAILRNELFIAREAILKKMNDKIGEEVIKEIAFK